MKKIGGRKDAPTPGPDLPDGRKTITFTVSDPSNTEHVDGLKNEAEILQQFRDGDKAHPGYKRIISLIEWKPDPVSLTMELIEPYGFDMMSLLMKYDKAKVGGGSMIKRSFRQLYDALCYLKIYEIVHGDLKCDNVLITRNSDVKLIDFGESKRFGERPADCWPCNDYIAPEVRGLRETAHYAQDMYGVYSIFNAWEKWSANFPRDVKTTVDKLGKCRDSRMTLEELGEVGWINTADVADSQVEVVLSNLQKSALPLKRGFAIQVTNEVLKMGQKKGEDPCCLVGCAKILCGFLAGCAQRLCSSRAAPDMPPVTIGEASLMASGGVQVMYVDRRNRKRPLALNEKPFVHVPDFNTKIDLGDWMYIGFPDRGGVPGAGAKAYFERLAKQAADYDTQVADAIPTWFVFDEFRIPPSAIGKCIGPDPETLPDKATFLKDALKKLQLPPSGFLNLRAQYQINLAGVKRERKTVFFPDATFVFQEGDVGLLVRAENQDGDTEPTHPPDRIDGLTSLLPKRLSQADHM